MTRYVLDASVAGKWFAPEVLTEQAERLRAHDVLAVDHILIEVASALLHKVRTGLYEGVRFAEDLTVLETSIELHDGQAVVGAAFQLASAHETSLYDSLYLALALREDCALVTADRRFFEATRNDYQGIVLWLGDVTGDSL